MPLPTQPVTADLNPERIRGLFYSPPGAGKTTFIAGWYPQTNLIIDLEGGTRFLPGEHFVVRPKSYAEFQQIVTELVTQQHHFKSVAIDTIDKLVRMADAEAGQRFGKVAAGLAEYGKGMADRDGTVLRDLQRLMSTDLGVLIAAHPVSTEVKVGENPAGEDVTEARWFPRVDQQDRLRQPIMGEVDFVLAVKKVSEEERQLLTGNAAGFETKRRVSLPDVLPADPAALFAAIKAGCEAVNKTPVAA